VTVQEERNATLKEWRFVRLKRRFVRLERRFVRLERRFGPAGSVPGLLLLIQKVQQTPLASRMPSL
jgi:hypothetical protein